MIREFLLTPGPTSIPERVLRAMSVSSMHHRTDQFKRVLKSAREGMSWLAEATEPPIFLACSGTGAMEAAQLNCSAEGDKIIVVNGGVFGERFSLIAKALKREVVEILVNWGQAVTLEQIEETLSVHADARCFCIQYCESSTTALHPVAKACAFVRQRWPTMLTIVDAISVFGTLPISVQATRSDVLIVASQKALMLPPGLSMLFLSERA